MIATRYPRPRRPWQRTTVVAVRSSLPSGRAVSSKDRRKSRCRSSSPSNDLLLRSRQHREKVDSVGIPAAEVIADLARGPHAERTYGRVSQPHGETEPRRGILKRPLGESGEVMWSSSWQRHGEGVGEVGSFVPADDAARRRWGNGPYAHAKGRIRHDTLLRSTRRGDIPNAIEERRLGVVERWMQLCRCFALYRYREGEVRSAFRIILGSLIFLRLWLQPTPSLAQAGRPKRKAL